MPSAALSAGTFGVRARRSSSSLSTASSWGSISLIRAETAATWSIRARRSSPWALPICLDPRFCCARRDSTSAVSPRRRSSSARIPSIASAAPRRASALRNGSGSSRIARTSSTSDLRALALVGLGNLGGLRLARRLGGLLVHDALALEDRALLDHEGLARDVAVHTSAACDLGATLHHDVALEPAGHRAVLRADVRLDLALRAERAVAVRGDLTLDLPVDPTRPGRDHRGLVLGRLTDHRHLVAVRHPLSPHPVVMPCLAPVLRPVLVMCLRVLAPPDHVAVTASRGPASACRIASSSSTDRLYGLLP